MSLFEYFKTCSLLPSPSDPLSWEIRLAAISPANDEVSKAKGIANRNGKTRSNKDLTKSTVIQRERLLVAT